MLLEFATFTHFKADSESLDVSVSEVRSFWSPKHKTSFGKLIPNLLFTHGFQDVALPKIHSLVQPD